AVLVQHGADRRDPEPQLVGVDVVDDHLTRRSRSAAAKNADAVLRISFARFSSAFSLRSLSSSTFSVDVTPGRSTASTSSRSIQFRRVAWLIPSSSPTRLRASSLDSAGFSRRRSAYIRTARARDSVSYFLGAGMDPVSLLNQSLHQTQDGSSCTPHALN